MVQNTKIIFVLSVFLALGCGRVDEPVHLIETIGTNDSALPGESELNDAVKKWGGKSVNGIHHSYVCQLARDHVDYMIEQKKISHDNLDQRCDLLMKKGATSCGEIVATYATYEGCAEGWRNSPGHWKHMKRVWDAWCYAVKKGPDGNLYCGGLFADGLPKPRPKIPPRRPQKQTPVEQVVPTIPLRPEGPDVPGAPSRSDLD